MNSANVSKFHKEVIKRLQSIKVVQMVLSPRGFSFNWLDFWSARNLVLLFPLPEAFALSSVAVTIQEPRDIIRFGGFLGC